MSTENDVLEVNQSSDLKRIEVPVKPLMTATELVKYAEQMISNINTLKKTAIQLTNENDWERLGNNPYLKVDGADKFILAFNVQQVGHPFFDREEFQDEKGGTYFIYSCIVKLELPTGATSDRDWETLKAKINLSAPSTFK